MFLPPREGHTNQAVEVQAMVHLLQKFRNYEIAERQEGGALELARSDQEIVCLAGQPEARRFAELHVIADIDATQPEAAEQVAGFHAAMKAWAEVTDPHITRVLEAGIDEGALFYVTEFIDGEELASYIERCQPFPTWLALELARQLTAGLRALEPWPMLLEKADLERAQVSHEGETTDEVRLRLTDFGISQQKGGYVAVSEAEGRAVRGVISLLARALGAPHEARLQAAALPRLPIPPALVRLLTTWLEPKQRLGAGSLEKWHEQVEHCALDPAMARRPVRLPHGFRVRLPLAGYFPSAEELKAEIGLSLQLEEERFDSALPYARRARWEGRAVTLHWLPPEHLMTPAYGSALHLAHERAPAGEGSPLLRVLAIGAGDAPRWFIEEAPPRLSLDDTKRLRGKLTPGEAVLLLQAVDSTVLFAEERGLTPVVLDPQQIFVVFDGTSPGDDELLGRPLDQWPSFCCQLRAHPIPLHAFQPARLNRSRLAGIREPRHALATKPSPTAADYAALFQWLCGGAEAVPASVATTVTQTLNGSGEPDRKKFLALLRPLAPTPHLPPIEEPTDTPPPVSGPPTPKEAKAPAQDPPPSPSARRRRPVLNQPTKAARAEPLPAKASAGAPLPAPTPELKPVDRASEHFPIPAQVAGATAAPIDDDAEPEGGFAEVLMGRPASASNRPELGDEEDAPPVGALFGRSALTEEDDEEWDEDAMAPLDFQSEHGRRGLSTLWLVLLVVGIALVIAALMAEITGLAPWRQLPPP